jgi:hypothetical protein
MPNKWKYRLFIPVAFIVLAHGWGCAVYVFLIALHMHCQISVVVFKTCLPTYTLTDVTSKMHVLEYDFLPKFPNGNNPGHHEDAAES